MILGVSPLVWVQLSSSGFDPVHSYACSQLQGRGRGLLYGPNGFSWDLLALVYKIIHSPGGQLAGIHMVTFQETQNGHIITSIAISWSCQISRPDQIQGLQKQTSPLNDRNTKWCAYMSGNHCSHFSQHLAQALKHLERTFLSMLGNLFSLLFSKIQVRSTNRDTGNDNVADSFSAFSSLFNFEACYYPQRESNVGWSF